jgi:maleate isomerase
MIGVESRPRIGAIYPDDAWVATDAAAMVDDFRSYMPAGVDLVAASTPAPNRTNTVEFGVWLAENGDIEEAGRRLGIRASPDVLAYYCTTVSFVRGAGGDADIARRMTDMTGHPATTTSTAMIAAMRAIGVRRVALASPYMSDVERKLIEFLAAHDIETVNSVALNLPVDHAIVPQSDILAAARRADRDTADAVFISCTGQRLNAHLDDLEALLGKPVLAANQVTSWHALAIGGWANRWRGPGRSLSWPAPSAPGQARDADRPGIRFPRTLTRRD